jgi:hypothetical protein
MKIPILVAGSVLALAVSVWCVKSALANPKPSSTAVSAEAKKPGHAWNSAPAADNPADRMETGSSAGASRIQVSEPVLWKPPASQAPVASPPTPVTPAKRAQASSPGTSTSAGPAATAAIPRAAESSSSGTSTGTPSSNGNSAAFSGGNPAVSGAEGSVLEVEPGVPLPAALLPSEEGSQSPTIAAAQQQIADSFVQEVDNALSQPETANSDTTVNDAYYDSLTAANEQYRALFGNAAYNQKTMQATLEAQGGN